MALEAESFRPLSEFFVHYVNDFRYRKEFFIQHVHVRVEVNYENLGRTADESFYTEKFDNIARYPPKSGSVMSYEELVQDPVCNAVSSYPAHHVICSSFYQLRRGETEEFSQDPLRLELVLTFFAVVFHYWWANL